MCDCFALPEYEDEQQKQAEKHRHIVHGAQHNNQLVAKCGHEADEFEDSQQSESSQHGKAAFAFLEQFQHAED
jgi:hypothetical protein